VLWGWVMSHACTCGHVYRYVYDDRDRHWDYHITDGRKYLSWDEYLEKTYGMVEGM